MADDLLKRRFPYTYILLSILVVFLGVLVYYRYQIIGGKTKLTSKNELSFGLKNIGITNIGGKQVNLKSFDGVVVKKNGDRLIVQNNKGNRINVFVTSETAYIEPRYWKCGPEDIEKCNQSPADEERKYENVVAGSSVHMNLSFSENFFDKNQFYEAGIIYLVTNNED